MVHIGFSKPLPECEGPKLAPFKDRKANVDLIRLLSDNEQNGQSHPVVVLMTSRKETALRKSSK